MEEMKVVKKESKKQERPEVTMEQLIEANTQLYNQNKQLQNKVQELAQLAFLKKMEFLFKIVENYTMFEPEYLEKATKEITDSLFATTDKSDETTDK